jgi:hypothetical protein
MTEMTLAVRITADGTALVNQLTKSQVEALGLKRALDETASGSNNASRATDNLARSQREQAAAARAAAAEQKRAAQEVASSLARQRQGYQQVGFQAQDFFTQIASGTSPMQAFAQNSGQMAQAVQILGAEVQGGKGKLATFASFLAGPWGIALGVALPLVTILATELFRTAEASTAAQDAIDGLSQSQSNLSNFIDVTTGKIREQISALQILGEVRRQQESIDTLRDEQRADTTQIANLASDSFIQRSALGFRIRSTRGGGLGFQRNGASGGDEVTELNRRLQSDASFTPEAYLAGIRGIARTNPSLRARVPEIEDIAIRVADRREDIARGEALQRMVQGEGTADDRRILGLPEARTDRTGGSARARGGGGGGRAASAAARQANELESFSERTGDAIARINDQWSDQPTLIQRANEATRDLNAIIREAQDKLEQRGLGAEQVAALNKTIADSRAGIGLVESGLTRPFREMLEDADRQLDIQRLIVAGREREAEVLSRIQRLQDQGVEVTAEMRAQIEGVVDAEERINMALDKREAIIGAYKDAIGDLRSDLEELFSGGSIGDFAANIRKNARRLQGRLLTEELFGDGLRNLEQTVRQQSGLEGAVSALDGSVRGAASAMETTGNSATNLANTLDRAANRIANPTAAASIGSDDALGDALAKYAAKARRNDLTDSETGDIVVTGSRGAAKTPDVFRQMASVLVGPLTPLLKRLDETIDTRLGSRIASGLTQGIAGYMQAGPVAGVLGLAEGSGIFRGRAGELLGKGFEGAKTGAQVDQMLDMFGVKSSRTGASLGGAVGGAVGGPLGEIVGSLIGGIVGGAMKSVKRASATITNTTGDASVSGNSAGFRQQSSALATSVQDTLANIAEQFGGTVGDFAVSIGVRDGKLRVDPTGQGVTKTKRGAIDFGEDSQGAIRAAILDAIADGGINGVSAAIQKALKSSTSLERGLKEALKVQEVEEIIGGIGSTLQRQFRLFEAQARDRVRIAEQYGFDVVKIEERNAEDRKKLIDQILGDRVGPLQQLLDDLRFGDLFEGSAADRRSALLGQVAKARADAEAGVDGAAQKLADLSRQLVETSRDAFGTAGSEFAGDRAQAISAAEKVIELENERIRQAQETADATRAATEKTAELMDENNELLARIAAGIEGGGLGAAQIREAVLAAANVTRQVDP